MGRKGQQFHIRTLREDGGIDISVSAGPHLAGRVSPRPSDTSSSDSNASGHDSGSSTSSTSESSSSPRSSRSPSPSGSARGESGSECGRRSESTEFMKALDARKAAEILEVHRLHAERVKEAKHGKELAAAHACAQQSTYGFTDCNGMRMRPMIGGRPVLPPRPGEAVADLAGVARSSGSTPTAAVVAPTWTEATPSPAVAPFGTEPKGPAKGPAHAPAPVGTNRAE